ncbi:MAG: hypothetical protein M1457_00535 [bacterium]|nr:hypothetical protein [bacterium]
MLTIQPNYEAFAERCRQGNLIPVWAELLADMETPVSAFRKLADGDHAFLLESVEHGERLGRYSFIGCHPGILIRSRNDEVNVVHGGDEKVFDNCPNPLAFLRDFMQRYRPAPDPNLPPFIGGAVGYMAYDLVRRFERLPDANPDDLRLPDCYFMIADTLAIFDHVRHRMILLSNAHVTDGPRAAYDGAVHKIERMAERLRGNPLTPFDAPLAETAPVLEPPHGELTSNLTREEFEEGVRRDFKPS